MKKKEFLRRFIGFRKYRNRNQTDWGEHTSKSREHQSRCENGRASLTIDELLAIAEAECIHPAEFFCFDPDSRQMKFPTDDAYEQEISALKKVIEHLLTRIGPHWAG